MKSSARAAGLGFLVAVMLPVSLVASTAPALAQVPDPTKGADRLNTGGRMHSTATNGAAGATATSGQGWEHWSNTEANDLTRTTTGAVRPNAAGGIWRASIIPVTADGVAEVTAHYPSSSAPSSAGTNLAAGKACAISVQWSSYACGNAFDGNTATRAISTQNQPSWVRVDLGGATVVRGARVLNYDCTQNKYLQSSDDTTTWTTRGEFTGGLGWHHINSTTTSAHRYWRILGVGGTSCHDVGEFELYGVEVGDNYGAGLAFRSGTKLLTWLVSCGSMGFATFARPDTSASYRPRIVDTGSRNDQGAGVACGSTAKLKVEYTGTTYKGYVNDTLVQTWTDTTSTVASTNTGAGIVILAENGVGFAGMRMTDFEVNNGLADPVGSLPLPDYKCGRTIRDVGGGQYFVDLEAFNLFPANVNTNGGDFVGYTDHDFRWSTSYGANLGSGQVVFPGYNGEVVTSNQPSRVTIALPPMAEMPAGGWTATFYVTRQADVNTYGDWTFMGGGDWHQLDQDGAAGPEPTKPWWMTASVWNAYQSLPPSWREGTVIGPGGVTYTGNTGDHWLPPTAVHAGDVNGGSLSSPTGPGWSVVVGSCTVTLNPMSPTTGTGSQTGTGANPGGSTGTTTTTVAGGTTTTTRPAGSHDTQGEDGTRNDCSAGFLGRIPVVGGVFDLAARLVCALKQLFLELFVPDNLSTHTDQLRQAWGDSKATSMFAPASAVVDLGSAFSAGYSPGGCSGPTVTMPAQLFGGFEFKPLDACSPPMSTFAGVLRTGLSVLLWVGGAFFLFRVFMVISGLGEGIE